MPSETPLQRRILDASVELLKTDGVGALSMREVARRAGVSHQAPYHHFADREAILAAIAAEGFALLADALRGAREAAKTMPERLKASGLAYVEFALSHPAHFRVMFRPELVDVAAFPDTQAEGARAFSELHGLIHDLMGEVDGLHGSEVAWTTVQWSIVHGLACLLLDGPLGIALPTMDERRAAAAEALDAMIGTMANQLRPRRAPKKERRSRQARGGRPIS